MERADKSASKTARRELRPDKEIGRAEPARFRFRTVVFDAPFSARSIRRALFDAPFKPPL